MSESPIVTFMVKNRIAELTLNRPQTRNAISEQDMVDAIVHVCEQINRNPDISVVILTGSGSAFCSGGNVKDMRDKKGMFGGDNLADNYRNGIQRIPLAVQSLEVPVIAAVNGPAIGAGCDLACMCDLRIAAKSAVFAESFIKLGLIPGDGGAWFLPKVVGKSRAYQMALTGQSLSAEQALAWNLVSEVVDDDALLARARELAEQIAANPPQAVRATKRLLSLAEDASLEEVLVESAHTQQAMHLTEDHQEAVAAFLEKRPPVFKGK